MRRLERVDGDAIAIEQAIDDELLVDGVMGGEADILVEHYIDVVEKDHANIGDRRGDAGEPVLQIACRVADLVREVPEAAAAKKEREAELRKQHLASIMQRTDTLWSGLDPLMDQKIASAYDQAAAQLQELRDAYAQAGDTGGFQQKLTGFRRRYSNRPAMLRRIEKL